MFLFLTSLHLLIIYLGDWQNVKTLQFHTTGLVLSILFTVCHIALCIVLRVKRQGNLLRGLLLYQLLGIFFFVLHFILLLLGMAGAFPAAENVFLWWTLPYQPLASLLAPVLGVSLKLRLAILYTVLVILTGKSFLGIRKDIAFERKIAEKHALEEESARRRSREQDVPQK